MDDTISRLYSALAFDIRPRGAVCATADSHLCTSAQATRPRDPRPTVNLLNLRGTTFAQNSAAVDFTTPGL
jgi:hypothetical protein